MRLISDETVSSAPIHGSCCATVRPSDDWFCAWRELGLAAREGDRIDAAIEVRGVAGEAELRKEARSEGLIAPAGRVARAPRRLGDEPLALGDLHCLLERDAPRALGRERRDR